MLDQISKIILGVVSRRRERSESAINSYLIENDLRWIERAALVSQQDDGLYKPAPKSGCVVVSSGGKVIAETFQKTEGTITAEEQAATQIKLPDCIAYLNLEPANEDAIEALVKSKVSRVVVGMSHPLPHLRNRAIAELRQNGVEVTVLGEDVVLHASEEAADAAEMVCLSANEALLHWAYTEKPFSISKFAMTLDGKIATSTGHAAWISSPASRQLVFAARSKSDAIVVGGNTVRRDNPNLTTRRESGFSPTRIVLSRTMHLPQDANLWNLSTAPTVVMTQKGAKLDFQNMLKDKGVEVVEFDFLSPDKVAEYCCEKGLKQLLWECGGTLLAPAIATSTIHKVMAFVAPKIIGGNAAPSPCGELGFVEMTQALDLSEVAIEKVGPDALITGYLPSSGGLKRIKQKLLNEGGSTVASPRVDLPGEGKKVLSGVNGKGNSHKARANSVR